MTTSEQFRRDALAAFAFLIRDCGFVLQQSGEARDESFLVFRRDDVLVTVNYASGDESWVVIDFVAEGRERSLKRLANERGLPMPPPADASVRGMLQRDAAVLRAWCTARARR